MYHIFLIKIILIPLTCIGYAASHCFYKIWFWLDICLLKFGAMEERLVWGIYFVWKTGESKQSHLEGVFFFFFQFPVWFASVFSMLLYINIQNYSSNTKKRREKYCVAIIHCFSLYLLDNMHCPTRNCQFLMLISVLGISLMLGSRKARSFFYLTINKE